MFHIEWYRTAEFEHSSSVASLALGSLSVAIVSIQCLSTPESESVITDMQCQKMNDFILILSALCSTVPVTQIMDIKAIE
jgi:hypothetical protein